LEGLGSLSLENLLRICTLQPRAYIQVLLCRKNLDRGSLVMFSGSLLSVRGRWKVVVELVKCYAVMSCTVLAYSFGYTDLEYCVLKRGCFSFSALSLIWVFYRWCTCSMYTAFWPINTPLASCCKSAKSWCRTCSPTTMNMIVCEVEQPPDMSQKFCIACSGWKKSCDRN
jgi:hypothetical protein